MIKKDTIVSIADGRLTLLQWLKKVEKALKDTAVTGFTATPTETGQVVFAMTFADGSTIAADPIAVPNSLNEIIHYNEVDGRVEVGSDLGVNGDELYLGGTKWLLADRGKDFAIVGTNEGGEFGDSLVVTHNDMFDGKLSIFDTFQFVSSLPMTVAQDEDTFGMFSFSSDGYTIYFCGQISASKAENRYYLKWGFGYSDTDSELFFCEDLGDGAVNYVENGQLYNDESVILSHLVDSNSADIRYSKATHQHTVLIKFNSSNNDVLAFTAMSSEHFEVTNLQELKNAFGGGRIACTGGDDKGTRYIYLDTRLENPNSYTVGYIDATGFHEDESLGSLTGTGGLTITDIVSNLN